MESEVDNKSRNLQVTRYWKGERPMGGTRPHFCVSLFPCATTLKEQGVGVGEALTGI